MSVTSVFIEKKLAIIRLKKISDEIPAITSSISEMRKLVDEGILSSEEANDMIDEYKSNIKSVLNEELSRSKDEAIIAATASEAETNSKVKGITPIIYGSPVITPPPLAAAASETKVLTQVPGIIKDLASILDNFNKFLSL